LRRFTIAALMVGILISGVTVAALKNASDAWAGVLLCVTLLILGVAILAVVYRRKAERAFCLGFALFGCSYMLIEYVPKMWDQAVVPLPTTLLLDYLHAKAHPDEAQTQTVQLMSQIVTSNQQPSALVTVPVNTSTTNLQNSIRLSLALVKSNLDQFVRIGHCLFALLSGLIGGLVGRWLHTTGRDPQPDGA
jgi:hypothetical protein